MNLLDVPEALHFVSGLSPPAPSVVQSVQEFHRKFTKTSIAESSTDYDIHRASLLSSVERWLSYGLMHYRRAFDMLVPMAAPWSHVTLYYSSFFAANAILGMFGGWVGHVNSTTCLVDVDSGKPGSQRFRVQRGKTVPKSTHSPRGSHQIFWDFFYDAVPQIAPHAPAPLTHVLQPVNSDFAWQTKARNEVNYDTYAAWSASKVFFGSFDPKKARTSAKGAFAQQLDTTEDMLRLALHFARELKLDARALDGCGHASLPRALAQRFLAKQKPPSVHNQSAFEEFLL